jgi:Lon protease-like protein
MPTSLPLFPLHTVLLPGMRLQLRIFEPRYVGLVAASAREDRGFGICLILEGHEAGVPAAPVAIGTEAHIVDFTSLPDGLLGTTVEGSRRFHVQRTHVRDNGLIVADVDWLPEPAPERIAVEHELLATLLQRLIERMGGEHARADASAYADAAWVSWRLAELLPIAIDDRQLLLQEGDPHVRMQQLLVLVAALQPG